MEQNKYQIMAMDPDKSLVLYSVAQKLMASGLYPNLKSPEAAFAVVQFGAELGYGPMVSLQNIQMVQGKPSCSALFLLAQMKRSGWNYRIVESTDKRCCMEFFNGKLTEQVDYTIEEAKTAGLLNKSGDMWKKYPKDMLFSRCSSRAARRLAPETSLGMYTEEELEYDNPSPAIGPDNAKNITPQPVEPKQEQSTAQEPSEQYPPYWENLSDSARELWGFLSVKVAPHLDYVNENLMSKASIPGFNHEAHLCNAVAQFLAENPNVDIADKQWWYGFREWRKMKKDAEKRKNATPSIDQETGEVLTADAGDDLPWDDNNLQKELLSNFDDNFCKLLINGFKAAGIKIGKDELLELAREAANNNGPGIERFNEGVAEYGNDLIAYRQRKDIQGITEQIPL